MLACSAQFDRQQAKHEVRQRVFVLCMKSVLSRTCRWIGAQASTRTMRALREGRMQAFWTFGFGVFVGSVTSRCFEGGEESVLGCVLH